MRYAQGFPAAQQFFPQNRLTPKFYPHPLRIHNTTMGYHISQVFKPPPQVPSCMPLTTTAMMDGHGLSRFTVHNYSPASQQFFPQNRSKQNLSTHEPEPEQDPSYSRWTVEEKYLEADIYIWWDMTSCPWPPWTEMNPYSIRYYIELALKKMNYRGTVEIFSYGDVTYVHPRTFDALPSQNIHFREPITEQGQDIAGAMSVDMMAWSYDNLCNPYDNLCKPANYLVITDKDIRIKDGFGCDVNILIAANEPRLGGVFLNKAISVWRWDRLVRGGWPLLIRETTNLDWFYDGVMREELWLEKCLVDLIV